VRTLLVWRRSSGQSLRAGTRNAAVSRLHAYEAPPMLDGKTDEAA
jgi:hypothetical protein